MTPGSTGSRFLHVREKSPPLPARRFFSSWAIADSPKEPTPAPNGQQPEAQITEITLEKIQEKLIAYKPAVLEISKRLYFPTEFPSAKAEQEQVKLLRELIALDKQGNVLASLVVAKWLCGEESTLTPSFAGS